MRQIEKEMNHAIRIQKSYFSKGNTAVRTSADGIESQIYLHYNLIGSYNHPLRQLTIFDGGWQSNTTKSRLNALLDEFAFGLSVFQKNFEWFIYDRYQEEVLMPFRSGYTTYPLKTVGG